MKITKQKLKQIIKEELDTLMREEDDPCAKLEQDHEGIYHELRLDPMSQSGMFLGDIEEKAKKHGCSWYKEWINRGNK